MNHSESINELASALCLAQSEMENAKKTSTNPFFKSKYADLAEVLDTVKPILNKYGLSVTQFPSFLDGIVGVETILLHTSGQWISGVSGSPIVKSDPQSVGAAISYLRRYSLAAVCGIAQEDDDGNKASGKSSVEGEYKSTLNRLMTLVVSKQVSEETQKKWLDWAKVDGLDKISEENALKLINKLEGM